MSNPFTSSQSPVFQTPVDAEFTEVPPEAKDAPDPYADYAEADERFAGSQAALDDHVYFYRQALGLITPSLLSRILGVDAQTIKRWRINKYGPTYLRIGKRVWYHVDDVTQWLPTQRVTDHATPSKEEDTPMSGTESGTETGQRRDYRKETEGEASSGGVPGTPDGPQGEPPVTDPNEPQPQPTQPDDSANSDSGGAHDGEPPEQSPSAA